MVRCRRPGPVGIGDQVVQADQVSANTEQESIAARHAVENLQFDAQIDFFADVFRCDAVAVGAPVGIGFRRSVHSSVDGQGPVQATHRLADRNGGQVFQCAFENTRFVCQWNRSVPFRKAHAGIKGQGPVGRTGDDTGIEKQVVFPAGPEGRYLLEPDIPCIPSAVAASCCCRRK